MNGGMVALLGLASAVIYGGSDFFGGLAARRISALLVSAIVFGVAIVLVAPATVLTAPVWSVEAVVLGVIAGLSGAFAQWAFFACLAIGPMSVLSPGVSAVYALLPAVVGISLGERFPVVGYLALVAVVVAAILLALTPSGQSGERVSPRALLLAGIAGVGYGGYVIAIDQTPAESGLIPLLVDLVVGFLVFVVILAVRRARSGPAELAGLRDPMVRVAVLAGVTLAIANILLLLALRIGDLAVVGVLTALYPLGTILLAVIVLRERLGRWQILGVVLALAASGTLGIVTS